MRSCIGALSILFVMTSTTVAFAQDDEALGDEALGDEGGADEAIGGEGDGLDDASEPGDAAATEADASSEGEEAASGALADGGRFRFGIAGGLGPLTAENIDMTYYGMDLRLGWQINDGLAVYAQPQLGYYKLDGADALFGSGGLIGASIVADYTLFDRIFFGGGAGFAILNNPSGAELHLRAGGYPLMGRSDTAPRRKGLMLGIDFRLHFVEGYTFVAPTFNVGYEAY